MLDLVLKAQGRAPAPMIKRPRYAVPLCARHLEFVEYIEEKGMVTSADMVDRFNFSFGAASVYLMLLVDKGVINKHSRKMHRTKFAYTRRHEVDVCLREKPLFNATAIKFLEAVQYHPLLPSGEISLLAGFAGTTGSSHVLRLLKEGAIRKSQVSPSTLNRYEITQFGANYLRMVDDES